MKKFLFSLCVGTSILAISQTSIQLTNNANQATITANAIINLATTANANTNITVNIKNTSGSAKSYNVIRYDMQLNAGSVAYYCFGGSCYGNTIFISPSPLTLNAGQSASQVQGSYNMLTADLDEGPTVGPGTVKYTFINTALASDSVQFTLKYNGVVGLTENANSISSFDAYPNPAKDYTSFKINSKTNSDAKLEVFNALGGLISTKNIQINEGKNKVDYNVENLPAGIYFASIKIGTTTTTKKFVVN
jgi:hypothetical protein